MALIYPATRTRYSHTARHHTSERCTSRVQHVEITSDLKRLAGIWPGLEATGDSTVFQAWDLFRGWVRHVVPACNGTWFVALAGGPDSNVPQFILPLLRRQVGTLSVIESADLGVSDFNGPVLDRNFTPTQSEMAAIWSELRAQLPPADLIRLSKLPAALGTHPNPLLLLPGVHPMNLSNFKTRLTRGGRQWSSADLCEGVRVDLEARRRKLGKRGVLRLHTAVKAPEIERYFSAMVEQRAVRCRALGRDNILDCPDICAFYRDLIKPEDPLSLGCIQALLLDDEIIATGYGLVHGDTFHMIFPTFKAERWRNYSPGLQHFAASMEWASQHGFSSFDFTIGDERFKADLGAERFPLYELLVALSPKGQAAVYDDRVRRFVRNHPSLRSLVNRVRCTLVPPVC